MTITSVAIREDSAYRNGSSVGQRTPKPPPRIWYAKDPPFKTIEPSVGEGYGQSSESTAIVIDNGQSNCALHEPDMFHQFGGP